MGAVAKSYIRKSFLIYEEMRKYLVTYEEAVSHIDFLTAPFWISLYVRKIVFSFLSVYGTKVTLLGTALTSVLRLLDFVFLMCSCAPLTISSKSYIRVLIRGHCSVTHL